MPTGKALIEEISRWTGSPSRLAFWWLGQASVILKLAGKIVYIDPYLSPDPRRHTPPAFTPEEATNADLVLGTHNHTDHIDPGAIGAIATASPKATVIVPRAVADKVIDLGVPAERLVGLNADETHRLDNVTITAITSKHEFFDRTKDGLYPYLGYVIQSHASGVYHAGDTVNYDGLLTRLQHFPLDVVFLPINGRDAARFRRNCIGNLTYQEAVDLAGELDVRLAVPLHYDMFAANSEDPDKFVDYLNAKWPRVRSWVGSVGETVELDPGDATRP